MTYKTLADVNATNDVSNLLVYVNDLTNGVAMPLVLFAFFIIAAIASAFAQLRFRANIRFDFSFAAAAFATFGFAVIMSLKNGLLNPIWLYTSLGVAILGAVWLYMAQE